MDRNFVQATTDEFAATAEIRNQIRKPLGGAGSGGIHNNNFKTNQSECLEFHDFDGVFWALCSIILSFFDLDSCRPMSLCRVLGGFPVKYSTFCAAKAMKLVTSLRCLQCFPKMESFLLQNVTSPFLENRDLRKFPSTVTPHRSMSFAVKGESRTQTLQLYI